MDDFVTMLDALTDEEIDEGYNRCLKYAYEVGYISREDYDKMERKR